MTNDTRLERQIPNICQVRSFPAVYVYRPPIEAKKESTNEKIEDQSGRVKGIRSEGKINLTLIA